MKIKKRIKLKLKSGVKKLIIWLIVITIISVFSFNKYKEYKYHQTNEYKLISIRYTKSEAKKIEKELTDKQVKAIIKAAYRDEFILSIIKEKYFLNKNLEKYTVYHKSNEATSLTDVVAIINVGADEDWYYHPNKADTSKKELVLVNKFNLLDETYSPDDIVPFDQKYRYGEVSATKEVYEAFKRMYDKAKLDNITLLATSGYRTYARQDELYKEIRNINGKIYADSFAARAGASEHETGLALDIFTYQATTEDFEKTDTYKWLDAHAADFGFILRYPNEKKYLTGYSPESWHFRYVGEKTAKKVKSLGITYDEYYAYYLNK